MLKIAGKLLVALAIGLAAACAPLAPRATSVPPAAAQEVPLDPAASVTAIADIVNREYVDPAMGERLSTTLLRKLQEGAYVGAAKPEDLAAELTRDLIDEAHDKHLAVIVHPDSSDTDETVRANAGTQAPRPKKVGIRKAKTLPGDIGYLELTEFADLDQARKPIARAMHRLRTARALIIDLRDNRGGSPDTVAFLAGYFFEEPGLPLFDIVSKTGDRETYTTPSPALPDRTGHRPLYILTSSRTFSGGEAFPYLLKERSRAHIIGETTAGAANPGRPYRIDERFEIIVPNARVESAVTRGNWENKGVVPDTPVPATQALAVAQAQAATALRRPAQSDAATASKNE